MAEGDLSPVLSRCRSGSDSEGELWLSLARAKTRSYGSTASVTATLGERYIEHQVTDGDTLQGIALKYGVTVRGETPVPLFLSFRLKKPSRACERTRLSASPQSATNRTRSDVIAAL